MAKLAQKHPTSIKTVVKTAQNLGEVWYAKPQMLGLVRYENGYWFTADDMRFLSARDAMEYLIRRLDHSPVSEPIPAPALPPKVRATVRKKLSITDPFVGEILDFLRKHPEIETLLKSKQD